MPVTMRAADSKQPKLSPRQQAELYRLHDSGNYTIVDLAELFSVSPRPCTAPSSAQAPQLADHLARLRQPRAPALWVGLLCGW